jgi:uncharacterized protein YxjI
MAGNEVAKVHRRLITLSPTYEISRGGDILATFRKYFFSPFVDRFTVDIPGPDDLAMTWSLFEHEYTISRAGQVVAVVSKHWFSLTEIYGVEFPSALMMRSSLRACLRSTWPKTGNTSMTRT